MSYAITFLEGVITFVSPCLLPMLPVYVAYFAGGAGAEAGRQGAVRTGEGAGPASPASPPTAPGGDAGRLRRTVVNALGFVAGFTALFVLMGGLSSTVGAFFVEHQRALDVACGLIVIVLGLNYLGILRIPALQRAFKPEVGVIPRSFASSLAFGLVFAIGWTPCVGAFLGSALSLAASSADTATGVALLLCYSLGLGVPFVISAVLIDRLEGAFAWVKSHYGIIDAVCGALLVAVGVLMATGTMGAWLRLLSL